MKKWNSKKEIALILKTINAQYKFHCSSSEDDTPIFRAVKGAMNYCYENGGRMVDNVYDELSLFDTPEEGAEFYENYKN